MVLLDDSHYCAMQRHGVSNWARFMARLNHPSNMGLSGRAVNKVPVVLRCRAAQLWR